MVVFLGNRIKLPPHTNTKENIMTTKNPYELRFDLLQFARSNLLEKYYAEFDAWKENRLPNSQPSFPTTEDVFNLAEKYKSFIEKK